MWKTSGPIKFDYLGRSFKSKTHLRLFKAYLASTSVFGVQCVCSCWCRFLISHFIDGKPTLENPDPEPASRYDTVTPVRPPPKPRPISEPPRSEPLNVKGIQNSHVQHCLQCMLNK
ncbi:hypothetical protein ACF0H5_006474 [Mactra antiquata]